MGKKDSFPITAESAATNISFQLGKLKIGLSSDSPLIGRFSDLFLEDWSLLEKGPGAADKSDIHIYLELVKKLPALPEEAPVFAGDERLLPEGIGTLSVYEQPAGLVLYFKDSGLVRIIPKDKGKREIRGYVTTKLLQYGRLHDLLFTTLSPYLRRQGYYLIHASAAVLEQKAFIFSGGSGSGKSTTILNLALKGWGFLSNDTLLLEKRPDGIYALPTPDSFTIRPKSLVHLPYLAAHLPQTLPDDYHHLSLNEFGVNYAEPARVSTIYFPEISDGQENQTHPLPPALTLARLLEFSLDKWDSHNILAHISFLEQLSRQAEAFTLQIAGQKTVPEMLEKNVKRKT